MDQNLQMTIVIAAAVVIIIICAIVGCLCAKKKKKCEENNSFQDISMAIPEEIELESQRTNIGTL